MRFAGWISYDWHGQPRQAVTGSNVVVEFRDRWITVSRPTGGTELVAWESVRGLRGFDHRLTEPTTAATNHSDSEDIGAQVRAKSHQRFSHCAQVRGNTSPSESRADEESKS